MLVGKFYVLWKKHLFLIIFLEAIVGLSFQHLSGILVVFVSFADHLWNRFESKTK